MTPVLLDQRSIFRAGIAVTLTMSVVFFTGYYVGHQKSDSGSGIGLNKTIALALPRPAHADTTEYEPLVPQADSPGANIDVDSPEDTLAAIEARQQTITQVQKPEAKVETVIQQTTSIIENSAISDSSTGQQSQQLQLASLAMTPEVFKADSEAGVIEEVEVTQADTGDEQPFNTSIGSGDQSEIIDTASADDARYTIQVGVYADSENALRRKSDLEAQQLSAYINDYTNKRDETRFNVRFGYFKDKSSALAALNSFEHKLSGSGYVTRIHRN